MKQQPPTWVRPVGWTYLAVSTAIDSLTTSRWEDQWSNVVIGVFVVVGLWRLRRTNEDVAA